MTSFPLYAETYKIGNRVYRRNEYKGSTRSNVGETGDTPDMYADEFEDDGPCAVGGTSSGLTSFVQIGNFVLFMGIPHLWSLPNSRNDQCVSHTCRRWAGGKVVSSEFPAGPSNPRGPPSRLVFSDFVSHGEELTLM
ncbi:unnamed protein product [Cylicostephanus goldi]|uniref:Uncharacterized protein n=1 Tax=Cylicostephanus goldi TaxID=71465 RepID=A0A3P6UTP4_CYLGO|nr:unnamed protein product [Cylicostephanus goldi]